MKSRFLALLLISLATLSASSPLRAMEGSENSANKKRGADALETPQNEQEAKEAEEKKRIAEKRKVARKFAAARQKFAEQVKKFEEKNKLENASPEKDEKKEAENNETCPICRGSLKGNTCTTVHMAGDKVPHTFHSWCLYNWAKQDEKCRGLLENLERGSKSEKKIALACPICHEEDTSQPPLPKKFPGDDKEKLQYPPKKFDISVAQLCQGTIEHLAKTPLKERFENLKGLPVQLVATTLIELAEMTEEERKKVYTTNRETDLLIQCAIDQKVIPDKNFLDGNATEQKQLVRKAVYASLTLLGDRPLAREYAQSTCKYLAQDNKTNCFKRAFDSLEILSTVKEILDDLGEDWDINVARLNDDEALKSVDYILAELLYSEYFKDLPIDVCTEYFLKLVKKGQPLGLFNGEVACAICDELTKLFVAIHKHLEMDRQREVLEGMFEAKNGGYGLLSKLLKEESISIPIKRWAVELFVKKHSISPEERLEIMGFRPYKIFCQDLLGFKKSGGYIFLASERASAIQKALVAFQHEGEVIKREDLQNALWFLYNQPIYREFYARFFTMFTPEEQTEFSSSAKLNNSYLFSDKEVLEFKEFKNSDQTPKNYLQRIRDLDLIDFYAACPATLPEEQLCSLELLLANKTEYAAATKAALASLEAKMSLEQLRKAAEKIGPAFAKLYPLLESTSLKMIALLVQRTCALKDKNNPQQLDELGNNAAAIIFDKRDRAIRPSLAGTFLDEFWDALSDEQRAWLFARMLDEELMSKLERMNEPWWNKEAAANGLKIFKKLPTEKRNSYIQIINNAFATTKNSSCLGDYACIESILSQIISMLFEDQLLRSVSFELHAVLQKRMRPNALSEGNFLDKDDRYIALCEDLLLFLRENRDKANWLLRTLTFLESIEKGRAFAMKHRGTLASAFIPGLTEEKETAGQLQALSKVWHTCDLADRRSTLVVAGLLIKCNIKDLIAILIKSLDWLKTASLADKKFFLRWFCKKDPQNRVAHHERFLKSCDKQEDNDELSKYYTQVCGQIEQAPLRAGAAMLSNTLLQNGGSPANPSTGLNNTSQTVLGGSQNQLQSGMNGNQT